jgi:hypothetical protein
VCFTRSWQLARLIIKKINLLTKKPSTTATDTISDGLGRYFIGEKLRALRLRKSMGLVDLGKHTGLSAALLSKLERPKLFPHCPRCCESRWSSAPVWIVGVVRKKDRVGVPERPGKQD